MAVPKQKISKSKRGKRRGGNGSYSVKLPNILVDPTSGEDKLAHHISLDGYYNGKKIFEIAESSSDNKEEDTKA